MSSRLGIDVGGTFTDLLLFDERSGAMRLLKTPSTPSDQSVGILAGIQQLIEETGIAASDVAALLHGTTVSTNIVLEEKGARVGLLVTENFEQVLHLARSQTPGPLAGWIIMQKPDPLADLELTRGVRERVNARGEVVKPLDEASARHAVRELIELGAESITVSLLHSYANPHHEQRIKAIIEETAPEMPVSLSSEILPEFREYERTLVTVMNAYVRPSMRRYLSAFEEKIHRVQFQPSVNIVRSDGGLMSVERASQSPVHTMLSGPAGGVSGAAFVATLAGFPRALGFDMGGTSTDVSLIEDGKTDDLAPNHDRLLSDKGALGRCAQRRRRRRLDCARADDRRLARRAGKRRRGAGPGVLRQGRRSTHGHRRQSSVRPPAAAPAGRQDDARYQGRGGSGREDRAGAEPRSASGGAGHTRHRQREYVRRAAPGHRAEGIRSAGFCPGRLRRRRSSARQCDGDARRLLPGDRSPYPRRPVGPRFPPFRRQERIWPDVRADHRRCRPRSGRRHSDQARPRGAGVAARRGHRGGGTAPELRGRRPVFAARLRIFAGDRPGSPWQRCAATILRRVSVWRTSASTASSSSNPWSW